MDAHAARSLLATAGLDGEIRLWQLDHPPAAPDRQNKPLIATFLELARPCDPFPDEEDLRITDGIRWYGPGSEAEDPGEDALPGAQGPEGTPYQVHP